MITVGLGGYDSKAKDIPSLMLERPETTSDWGPLRGSELQSPFLGQDKLRTLINRLWFKEP